MADFLDKFKKFPSRKSARFGNPDKKWQYKEERYSGRVEIEMYRVRIGWWMKYTKTYVDWPLFFYYFSFE